MSVILCTGGYDHTIRFWEALSGICSRTIPHPDSQVNRLCISPDKRYLAAAGHHTVKLYDIKSTNPNAILTFDGHTSNITGVAFHVESKWLVTSSEDGTVKIWDTRSGNVQRNYTHGVPVNDVVIHPNQGELISCDRGGNVRIWDLGENKCSHQLIPEDDVSVASVTVASDGSMVCAGNNTVSLNTTTVAATTCGHANMDATGQRLRLAYDPAPRHHLHHSRLQVRRPRHIHHPRPALARRAPPRDLLRRPHRPHMVPRHRGAAQPAAGRQLACSR